MTRTEHEVVTVIAVLLFLGLGIFLAGKFDHDLIRLGL